MFLGVHGMSARAGFTTPNLLEAETVATLAAKGRRLVVVADHTKFDVVGIATVASLDSADVVVTDSLLDEEARRILGEHVDQVVLAPVHIEKRP
nr:hypothetical protein GCM10025732_02940 [Glycomyces mayteni]